MEGKSEVLQRGSCGSANVNARELACLQLPLPLRKN